ncbi:ATP synthase subunit alpha [Cucumis melo var. makuwa]|uniref:ATP synthase subunit alpha n=1 Tax=Cucumis melo var. makuwa TaxID=1194695 RepID=A0A5A7T130_CUCMM|nr:ATP synthase subunit alpha [Cucumis melo var. makuwa]TYK14339.1 ATP synthase subunit alpha [Cucumis melo var. makuwa]
MDRILSFNIEINQNLLSLSNQLPSVFFFFTHAILLDRAFAHCPRFPTTAPCGSPGRVSVLVWLIIRKDQLNIIGLVSLYLTNDLILCRLIKQRFLAFFRIWLKLFGRFPRVTHSFATLFSTLPTSKGEAKR